MDRFRAMKLFVQLAEQGSFTRAAEQLDISKSLISKEISRLEADLGVRLLQRSTRRLQLTEIGEGYLQRCQKILRDVEDADSFAEQQRHHPAGRLRVNAPTFLGISVLSRTFADFMQAYPQVQLDIELSDNWLDMVEHGFDLSIRVASRPFDSAYVGRTITHFTSSICASPAYLASHPKIGRPADLKLHNCFTYTYYRGGDIWPLSIEGEDGVEISGTLRVNSSAFMRPAILRGLGIGFMPSFVCDADLAAGRMVEVLPRIKRPVLTMYALHPARQYVPPKVSAAIDFLQTWFKGDWKKRIGSGPEAFRTA